MAKNALQARVDKAAARALTAHKGDLTDILERALARFTPVTRPAPERTKVWVDDLVDPLKPKRRTRRTGRVGFRRYELTLNASYLLSRVRRGTFRKYMLETILAHTDTSAAQRAHETSGQHEGHKLDFSWAAENGYITFIGG